FEYALKSSGHIQVMIGKGFFFAARFAKNLIKLVAATAWATVLISEVREINVDAAFTINMDDFGYFIVKNAGVAEWRQAHGFAFVIVGLKAAKFGYRFVKGTQRHRENRFGNQRNIGVFTVTNKRCGPFTRAVKREQCSGFIG